MRARIRSVATRHESFSKMTSKIVKCNNCNLVVCEVLAFIQNKLDVMSEDSLVRICATSFTAEEIAKAKSLLFESIPSEKKKVRKNAGKTQRNLNDVIKLLKECDAEEIPTFVSKDLQKLPPICFDHIDVTKLLKDILVLRNDIQEIKSSYVTELQHNELKKQLENLQLASVINAFDCNNVTCKRGGGLVNSFYADSGPIGLSCLDKSCLERSAKTVTNDSFQISNSNGSPVVALSRSDTRPNRISVTLQQKIVHTNSTEATSAYSAAPCSSPNQVVSVNTEDTPLSSDHTENRSASLSPERWSKLQADSADSNKLCSSKQKKITENDRIESWNKVQYKRKKKMKNTFSGISGKANVGPNNKFRAADINVPLYINKVSKLASEQDIIDHINNQTQINHSDSKEN